MAISGSRLLPIVTFVCSINVLVVALPTEISPALPLTDIEIILHQIIQDAENNTNTKNISLAEYSKTGTDGKRAKQGTSDAETETAEGATQGTGNNYGQFVASNVLDVIASSLTGNLAGIVTGSLKIFQNPVTSGFFESAQATLNNGLGFFGLGVTTTTPKPTPTQQISILQINPAPENPPQSLQIPVQPEISAQTQSQPKPLETALTSLTSGYKPVETPLTSGYIIPEAEVQIGVTAAPVVPVPIKQQQAPPIPQQQPIYLLVTTDTGGTQTQQIVQATASQSFEIPSNSAVVQNTNINPQQTQAVVQAPIASPPALPPPPSSPNRNRQSASETQNNNLELEEEEDEDEDNDLVWPGQKS